MVIQQYRKAIHNAGNATNVAGASIYALEGMDIRHQHDENE